MIMEGFRVKLLYTAVVYFLFLQLALRFGIFGPTMLDFEQNLGVNYEQMSNSLAITCFGVCIGAIGNGFILKFLSIETSSFIFMLTTAILVGSMAFLKNYTLFLAWCLVVGITSGAAITTCESWILKIWGSECGPYMQALQFFRGLGYIVGPVLVDPFLDQTEHLTSNTTLFENSTVTKHKEFNANIQIPYGLNAIMIFAGALCCLGLFMLRKYMENKETKKMKALSQQTLNFSTISLDQTLRKQSTDSKIEAVVIECKNTKRQSIVEDTKVKYFGYTIVALCSVFYLFFYEEVIVSYVPSFATKIDLKLTKSQASLLTSAFNIANVAGKAISVVLALKLSHVKMLYMNLTIMLGSLIFLIIFANNSVPALWIGLCIHGIGLSSIVASLYTLMEQSIEMNPLICGILNMCGTAGSVISPLIIGKFMEKTPMIVLYLAFVCTICCIIIITLIVLLLKYKDRIIARPMSTTAPVHKNSIDNK